MSGSRAGQKDRRLGSIGTARPERRRSATTPTRVNGARLTYLIESVASSPRQKPERLLSTHCGHYAPRNRRLRVTWWGGIS
jgi:hypothetical protein